MLKDLAAEGNHTSVNHPLLRSSQVRLVQSVEVISIHGSEVTLFGCNS